MYLQVKSIDTQLIIYAHYFINFRFLAGKIVDYPCVNKILFHQVSFLFSGIIPMLMLLTPHLSGFEFKSLIILALVLGCFDGIFVSLWVPIANEICGTRGTSQAIGFMLGFCSIPLTLGPTFSGYLYDLKKDYVIAFIISGVLPIIGALLMTSLHFFKPRKTTDAEMSDEANASKDIGQRNMSFVPDV